MKLRLKHIRHPLRTANVAGALVAQRWNLWRFVARGERHFAGDARYDLASVTNGFAAHIDAADIPAAQMDDQSADAVLLERICTAYIKAAKQQQVAPKIYGPTGWWEQQRQLSLQPIIQALMARDYAAVRRMYENFYRDPCSAGLILAQGMSKDYFGETIKDFHRRLYLVDTLYRLDYWKVRTGGRLTPGDLSGPSIGNPFGVVIEGTLVRAGAEYQYYCAHRITGQLDSKPATVAEVGGGFGGMAYYLLRDHPGTTYIDFDVPESIALTSYFLLKAFSKLRFLLYGEEALTKDAISRADVVLMPAFELASVPAACADLTFSSHAMSDLSAAAMASYLKHIGDMTRDCFLYIGNGPSGKTMSDLVAGQSDSLRLAETRSSGWHDHRIQSTNEVEQLYRIRSG